MLRAHLLGSQTPFKAAPGGGGREEEGSAQTCRDTGQVWDKHEPPTHGMQETHDTDMGSLLYADRRELGDTQERAPRLRAHTLTCVSRYLLAAGLLGTHVKGGAGGPCPLLSRAEGQGLRDPDTHAPYPADASTRLRL